MTLGSQIIKHQTYQYTSYSNGLNEATDTVSDDDQRNKTRKSTIKQLLEIFELELRTLYAFNKHSLKKLNNRKKDYVRFRRKKYTKI